MKRIIYYPMAIYASIMFFLVEFTYLVIKMAYLTIKGGAGIISSLYKIFPETYDEFLEKF